MTVNFRYKYVLLLANITLAFTASPRGIFAQNGSWQSISPASGAFTGREENSYAAAGDKFYLIGGKAVSVVQEYNPISKKWVNKSKSPVELHHFQPVTLNGLIYAVGAMNGRYPHEVPLTKVYLYNPSSDKWLTGSTIPVSRRRGAGGAIAYKNKIYLVGGIKDGHYSGWVNWFDEFDPATNTWKIMPNAPRVRDHFQVVIINNKLYVAGGRRSSASTGQTFDLTIPEVDVYDFVLNKWSTLPGSSNLPVPRAGAATVVLGDELIIIGGESGLQVAAHKETHALDVTTNKWRRLADLRAARHGTGAVVSNKDIYIVAGAGNRGSVPKILTQEDFFMVSHTTPNGNPVSQSLLGVNANLSFGSIATNTESSQTLRLTNTGSNQDILLSSIELSGKISFSYSAPFSFPFTVSPGKYIDLMVKFKPTTTGAQTADLLIMHSGKNDGNTVSLSGTGSLTNDLIVSNFTLVDTESHNEEPLNNGEAINVAPPGGSINIRANASPQATGSVVFKLSGKQTKTQVESGYPYALFGDSNGTYIGWSPPAGEYTLTATPYTSAKGTGTAGTTKTITFTVTNQAVLRAGLNSIPEKLRR